MAKFDSKRVGDRRLDDRKIIPQDISDCTFEAVNAGLALMKRRIFTQNKDVNGITLGKYKDKKYKALRLARGLLVDRKNLQFSDNLFNSIQTERARGGRSEIRFRSQKYALIARGQEAQINNIRKGRKGTTKGARLKIFTLSKEEIKFVRQVARRQVEILVRNKRNRTR